MLAYDDQGAGPPLVFLPGITCSMAHWGPVSDLLKSEFRCVRIDPPGHGASEGPGADVFGQTAAINEVVGHLGLGRPMMVGHSAGGVTALVYALLHPAAGVVVVDQPLDVAEWGSDVVAMKDRLLDPATFRDAFFEFIARFRGDLVPEERQALLTDHIDPRYEVVMAMWEPFLTGDAHDATAQLATALPDLAVPLLAIYANELSSRERRMLDLVPNATVEVWEGLGHFIHLSDPVRLANRLRAFAEGGSSFRG